MNSEKLTNPDQQQTDESIQSIGADNTHLSSKDILSQGNWERMDGNEIRWQWVGAKNTPISQIVEPGVITHRFNSASNGRHSIHLCKLSDGGIISYQLENNNWVHTLNTVNSFRMKVFELNLVPLESLRYFLTKDNSPVEPALPPESVE